MSVIYHCKVESNKLPSNATAETYLFCVKIDNIPQHASDLVGIINDKSWISELNPTAKTSYEKSALRTINKLVHIFENVQGTVTREFGEYMVSIAAGDSLRQILNHQVLPISELWKEKLTGNPGFDFHTVSTQEKISFGEAKYKRSQNPYTEAAKQAVSFIRDEKDNNDAVHLINFVSGNAMRNLYEGKKGVCIAFSLHSIDHETILDTALNSDFVRQLVNKCDELYIIGVKE